MATCQGGCHLSALEHGVCEQAGDEVLALALPDQVDVRDLVVARLQHNIAAHKLMTNKGKEYK